jgi:hypothetical protein
MKMIRNLKGAFVVVRESTVSAHILESCTFNLFMDRVRVSGEAQANKATFGNDALYAFPCTEDCMTFIALNYNGVHEGEVKAMCACIALGQPFGNGKDITEGGLGVVTDDSKPIKPKGGAGAKAKPPVTADSLTSMLKAG